MDHESLKDRLPELSEGSLPLSERAELEAHLQGCAACRAERARWTALSRALLRVPEPASSERFVRAVLDASRPPARRFPALEFGLAFAAACLLVAPYPASAPISFDEMLLAADDAAAEPLTEDELFADLVEAP